MVQGQLADELVDLALMADQTQVRRIQDGRQQGVGGQFGESVGQAHRQALDALGGRLVDLVRHHLADLEDLLGAGEGGLAGLGQHQATALGLEQLMPQRSLEFPHLRADRLHRHAEPVRRAGETALLGDDPEVVQMAVVEGGHGRASEKNEAGS